MEFLHKSQKIRESTPVSSARKTFINLYFSTLEQHSLWLSARHYFLCGHVYTELRRHFKKQLLQSAGTSRWWPNPPLIRKVKEQWSAEGRKWGEGRGYPLIARAHPTSSRPSVCGVTVRVSLSSRAWSTRVRRNTFVRICGRRCFHRWFIFSSDCPRRLLQQKKAYVGPTGCPVTF